MKRNAIPALIGALLTVGAHCAVQAAEPVKTLRLGVLTDMSGPYSSLAGRGSVVAAQMAIDDCLARECRGMKIDLIAADHQNKADLASSKAREWFDTQHVDALVDLVNASVQLAIQKLVVEKDKVALYPGGTSRLTNEDCAPGNSVQWLWDTYAQVAAVTRAINKPGTSWYYLTADYAFGKALESDGRAIIEAGGGKFLGSNRHPFPNADFSSAILQAQSSKANYIGLANAGADTINAIKAASEFGVTKRGQKVVGFILSAQDVHSIGLQTAQGAVLAESFYWDYDDQTRAWSSRYESLSKLGKPSMIHAGVYSSVYHYLKAAAASKTTQARDVIQ
ncbi:ABC transporter substrate-binding protein [Herbaspirillum sp. NPDC087042]|uniref:ABC transporter substrate-binding protein n=1 Tax=Herbaspirillum sp. NPDC087042 TaxID=3364004 RepID=UPI003825459E